MPPLIVFSLVHWVAQPLWWDRETSYSRSQSCWASGEKICTGILWWVHVRSIAHASALDLHQASFDAQEAQLAH